MTYECLNIGAASTSMVCSISWPMSAEAGSEFSWLSTVMSHDWESACRENKRERENMSLKQLQVKCV